MLLLRPLCPDQLSGALYAFDDALITGAAADVAGQTHSDFLLRRARIFGQQRYGAHDKAGCTEAALERVAFPKCLLHRVHYSVLLEALDRLDLRVARLHRQQDARTHRLAVQQDGACAAHAVLAAEVCTRKAEVLAQRVGEGFARLYVQFATRSVHGELHVVVLGHAIPPDARLTAMFTARV